MDMINQELRKLCDDRIEYALKNAHCHSISTAYDAGYLDALSDVFQELNDLRYYRIALEASKKVFAEGDF